MKFTKAIVRLKENWLLQKVENTNNFLVKSEFFWILDYKVENSEMIIIPKDFSTDFWSIPQFLWWLFNPTKYLAYILHDFLYSKEYIGKLNRKDADKILKEALKVEGMWRCWRWLVYLAVRLFWWQFYKK